MPTCATPVYLETARNPYGFIGGIDAHCFEESYLRELIVINRTVVGAFPPRCDSVRHLRRYDL